MDTANAKATCNVAIIGTKFMGKAHSNAWLNTRAFDLNQAGIGRRQP